jgi:cytochrome P450
MQDEIDRFIKTNGRIPSFTDRESCPYCVSTIKECLRYRSPTPFGGSHVITKDAVISGYFIPEGSTVITSMDAINLSTTDYKDAEKFSPERFMHDTRTMAACANGKVEERDHLSFGWGRHVCPGIYLVS